jgi:hypothetical protein
MTTYHYFPKRKRSWKVATQNDSSRVQYQSTPRHRLPSGSLGLPFQSAFIQANRLPVHEEQVALVRLLEGEQDQLRRA